MQDFAAFSTFCFRGWRTRTNVLVTQGSRDPQPFMFTDNTTTHTEQSARTRSQSLSAQTQGMRLLVLNHGGRTNARVPVYALQSRARGVRLLVSNHGARRNAKVPVRALESRARGMRLPASNHGASTNAMDTVHVYQVHSRAELRNFPLHDTQLCSHLLDTPQHGLRLI